MTRINSDPLMKTEPTLVRAQLALAGVALFIPFCWGTGVPGAASDREHAEKQPYVSRFLCFGTVDCEVDPQGKNLYCVDQEAVAERARANNTTIPPSNIFTRWSLPAGKCEAIAKVEGKRYIFRCISPGGKWILALHLDPDKIAYATARKERFINLQDLGLTNTLIRSRDLRQEHAWPVPTIPLNNISKEFGFFLEEERLGFLALRVQDTRAKPGYTFSVWRFGPRLEEEYRVPLFGLEDYMVAWVEAKSQSTLILLTYQLAGLDEQSAVSYLLFYDVRSKAITTKQELGKVPLKEGLTPAKVAPVSIAGLNSNKDLVLVHLPGKGLLCSMSKQPQVIDLPCDFRNELIPASDLSPDGGLIVFASTRIVIYNVAEDKYRLLDTQLEDLCDKWNNPPPGSQLSQMLRHPTVAALTPIMQKLMYWRCVKFLGRGEHLLGITTYGKVVIWDVKSGKIINSFRIQETCFDRETERILGLY